LRIAADVSQADLAKRLDVDPSQVSRDERNEYHGITIDRAAKIIRAPSA
jgi:transcriptional regulator with XRE-family HTH domain